ncbi:MAG: hypothetical protein V7637_1541 [Mycobacteriales bacterium]|jgi:hypothetical protein
MWLILHLDLVAEKTSAFARRWGLSLRAPEPPMTYEYPVERIAADLRRLSVSVRHLPPGCTNTRRQGLLLAYDHTLVAGCRALGLAEALSELPPGTDRDLERMRVENSLESAGLRFRPVTW